MSKSKMEKLKEGRADVFSLKVMNRYYGLRHGESDANAAGIIVSNPVDGTKKYGLTSNGVKQVENSCLKFISNYRNQGNIMKFPIIRTFVGNFKYSTFHFMFGF